MTSIELPEIDLHEIPDAYGYMYILQCAGGYFYTGSTTNLLHRLNQHQSGDGARFTADHLPFKLVYYETFDRIDTAFQREKQIQGWSRAKKIALIQGDKEKLIICSKSKLSASKALTNSSNGSANSGSASTSSATG